MGVRGLQSALKHHAEKRVALKDQLLVIDGTGWLYWLIHTQNLKSMGFSYTVLASDVMSFVNRMKKAAVVCCFVFDGATHLSGKMDTKMSRIAAQCKGESFILPLLSERLVMEILRLFCRNDPGNEAGSISVVRSMSEADLDIAKIAVSRNALAIVTQDTDFYIYQYAPSSPATMQFWTIGFSPDGTEAFGYIRHQSDVARFLGLSINELPYLAALVGYDYSIIETLPLLHDAISLFKGKSKGRSKKSIWTGNMKSKRLCRKEYDVHIKRDMQSSEEGSVVDRISKWCATASVSRHRSPHSARLLCGTAAIDCAVQIILEARNGPDKDKGIRHNIASLLPSVGYDYSQALLEKASTLYTIPTTTYMSSKNDNKDNISSSSGYISSDMRDKDDLDVLFDSIRRDHLFICRMVPHEIPTVIDVSNRDVNDKATCKNDNFTIKQHSSFSALVSVRRRLYAMLLSHETDIKTQISTPITVAEVWSCCVVPMMSKSLKVYHVDISTPFTTINCDEYTSSTEVDFRKLVAWLIYGNDSKHSVMFDNDGIGSCVEFYRCAVRHIWIVMQHILKDGEEKVEDRGDNVEREVEWQRYQVCMFHAHLVISAACKCGDAMRSVWYQALDECKEQIIQGAFYERPSSVAKAL